MSGAARTDVVIFGGGVAGLWTRCVLSKLGYSVVLFDVAPMGTGQTLASQGILHAGIKYALSGKAGRASRMLAEAAAMWRDAMRGEGDVDLRDLSVLAESMYIWTRDEKTAKLAAWGASKAMRSGVRKFGAEERPALFDGASDGIDVYQVDEPVIDTADLLVRLQQAGSGPCFKVASCEMGITEQGDETLVSVDIDGDDKLTLIAKRVVFSAGVGNETLLRDVEEDAAHAQRRPLHMVVVRNAPVPLFGHCLRMSDVPVLTITTSDSGSAGQGLAWVVGGELAERGVARSQDEQIAAAQRELAEGLPWLDLSACEFDTFRIDRAEGRTSDGMRPDEPVIFERAGIIAAWPTKLVLAPIMAKRIAEILDRDSVTKSLGDLANVTGTAAIGLKPWQIGRAT